MGNNLSRPLVGSSRKSKRGLIKISKAMLTLLFSPPLIPRKCQFPITVSAQSCSPIATMVLSTSALLSDRDILSGKRSLAEYHIVSRTVKVPIRLSSCVTYACYNNNNNSVWSWNWKHMDQVSCRRTSFKDETEFGYMTSLWIARLAWGIIFYFYS